MLRSRILSKQHSIANNKSTVSRDVKIQRREENRYNMKNIFDILLRLCFTVDILLNLNKCYIFSQIRKLLCNHTLYVKIVGKYSVASVHEFIRSSN